MDRTSKVEIDVDALGFGSVIVDERQVSDLVSRVTVDSRAGEPTLVFLEAKRGVSFVGEGLVLERADDGGGVLAFLQNVDVVALEAAAMAKLEGLDGVLNNPMAAALVVLQEWAAADGGT